MTTRRTVASGSLKHRADRSPDMFDLAYLAGFLDADGCISISPARRTTYYLLTVSAAGVDRAPLDKFRQVFGGKLLGPTSRGPRSRPVFVWSVQAKRAEEAVRALLPFLVLKRERALLALQFRATFQRANALPRGYQMELHEDKRRVVLARREGFYQQFKVLNARGVREDEIA